MSRYMYVCVNVDNLLITGGHGRELSRPAAPAQGHTHSDSA